MFARAIVWAWALAPWPQATTPVVSARADRPAQAQESQELVDARRQWRAADTDAGPRLEAAARVLKLGGGAELVAEIESPASTAAQVAALEALTRAGSPIAARAALAWLPGSESNVEHAARAYLQKLASERRGEFVAAVVQVLGDASADPAEWCGGTLVAASSPDLAFVPALLTRLEQAAGGAGHLPDCIAALERISGRHFGSALPAWRRWWSEGQGKTREQLLDEALAAADAELAEKREAISSLEVERLRAAPAEACAAALDDESSAVRRVALERLAELLRRGPVLADEAVLKLRARVLAHVGAPIEANASGDEEAAWGALAAEVAPRDPAVVALLLARFRGRDPALPRVEYIPALRRAVREQPDATVARTIESALAATADAAARRECAQALGVVGDDASSTPVAALLADAGTGPALREAALSAIAEIARRGRDPAVVRRAVDLLGRSLNDVTDRNERIAAALGLGVVLEGMADARSASPATAAAVVENVNLAFEALRRALPSAGSDRALAEPCCRALCRVTSRRDDAARLLSDVLASDALAPKVREVYVRGLKELEHPAALGAIAAALPRGGPSVEPDAVGREAYAALQAILRRAAAEGHSAAVTIAACDACAAREQHEWVVQLATPLLAKGTLPDGSPELRHTRLLFGECSSKLLDPEILDRGLHELEALLAEKGADAAERLRATKALLAIGDRNRSRAGREAAERASEELAHGGFDAEARREIAKRAASLLFALGDWNATAALLSREFVAGSAPVDVLVTWAHATARIEGESAVTQSLALHERLLGARAAGGCLAADAPERPALLVSLARLYVAANRRDDARAVLKLLAAPSDLPPELKRERDRLDGLLKNGSPPGGK
jgi:hypothetical protein